jgi:hypothetical protein
MNRRDFLKKSLAIGAAAGIASFLGGIDKLAADESGDGFPDLVAVKGGEPGKMYDEGIKAIGGIGRFVKKGTDCSC